MMMSGSKALETYETKGGGALSPSDRRKIIKNKVLAAILCGVMVMAMFTACGSKDDKQASTTGSASGSNAEKKTFTLGFDAAFPPYGYQDESGEYVGFDLDLAAEVCKRNGWELVKQPVDWDSKDMELNSGAIDCIWNGFTMSEDRIDTYEWTEPYVDNSQVFVVKADSGIKTKADLKGKNVLVQADSSALEALKSKDNKALKDSFANLDEVPEYNTAFLNLEAGSGNAIAMDIGVAKYQIEKRGADKFVMLEEKLATEQYGIGFKLGNKELRDRVQKTLKEMVKDGKFAEIAAKWKLTDAVCLKAE